MILRSAARHTYEQKSLSAIDWKLVRSETYNDTRHILERWCRNLTDYQVKVIEKIVENRFIDGASFSDTTMNNAANILIQRGILIHPIASDTGKDIEGVFKVCTPLLIDYVNEGNLTAQYKAQDNVEQVSVKLSRLLEEIRDININDLDEESTKQIIDLYAKIAQQSGYPQPVDFNSPVSDTELQKYELTKIEFDSFNKKVKELISIGIRVDCTLSTVNITDYAASYISFAKAIETHLNKTLVPVLKKCFPNETYSFNGKTCTLSRSGNLMIGTIQRILNNKYDGTGRTFLDKASQYFTENFDDFDLQWWKKYAYQ